MQKVLKNSFDFYIKSSTHVALSVLALAELTSSIAGLERNIPLLIFIFSSALSAYNFIKYFPLFTEQNQTKINTFIFLITIGSFILSLITVFFLPHLVLGFIVLGGSLVLGYAIPFHKSASNWRSKKGWKLYLVVLSWLSLTVGVPLAAAENFDTLLFVKLVGIQGIYIFVAILPFEIGDLNSDEPNLQTLPQRYGVLRVKIIGLILLFLGGIMMVFSFGHLSSITICTLFIFFILGILLWKSNKNQSLYYARFWVEGIPILWSLLFYYF